MWRLSCGTLTEPELIKFIWHLYVLRRWIEDNSSTGMLLDLAPVGPIAQTELEFTSEFQGEFDDVIAEILSALTSWC